MYDQMKRCLMPITILVLLAASLLQACDAGDSPNLPVAASPIPNRPELQPEPTETAKPIIQPPPSPTAADLCPANFGLYPNAQEDLAAKENGIHVYLSQDPVEQVIAFYQTNPPDPNCREIIPRVKRTSGLYLSCQTGNLNVHIIVAPPEDGSTGAQLRIECTPQD